jgi:CheY-like chemotaxis protein
MTDTQQQWWYVFDEQTRILVVDDDPILREFASVYLTPRPRWISSRVSNSTSH